MKQSQLLPTNKWFIEQRDVKRIALLVGGEERTLRNEDVGRVYVVSEKGDYIEDPPLKEEFENEEFE